jgi:hypothetical protein
MPSPPVCEHGNPVRGVPDNMKPSIMLLTLLLAVPSLDPRAAQSPPSPVPLTRAHAHNDYEHARPLFDALDHGFCSIEADIYLVDGQLLVAHDRDKVRPERTLQALYLDPLRHQVQMNGGRLYKGGPPAILLIDVKTEGDPTYAVLRTVLRRYSDIFTSFSQGQTHTNALSAIISGNRPGTILSQESVRYAAIDGRPQDLDGNAPNDLIPLVSQDWKRLFKWQGVGAFPEAERERLVELVGKAHQQGRIIRFWGTPDRMEMWRALYAAGVDLLNADDLSGLRDFLLQSQQEGRAHRPG